MSVELQQALVDGVTQGLDKRTIAANQLNICLDHASLLLQHEGTPNFISKDEWQSRIAYVYKTFEENDDETLEHPENSEIDR